MKLGELPEEEATPQARHSLMEKLGFNVQNLDRQLADRLGLDPSEKGVVVTNIDPSSEAFAAGLREGDLIKEVNRHRVTNVREFSRIIDNLKSGDTVLIYALRKSARFFVAFKIK